CLVCSPVFRSRATGRLHRPNWPWRTLTQDFDLFVKARQRAGMNGLPCAASESLLDRGGRVPGAGGQPAYELRRREPTQLPVLIAVPHAGRCYPDRLTARMRNPGEASLRLEDRFVDLVANALARETGAALLVAHAPRAMIDLNRAPDDIDWSMVADR